MNPTKKLRDIIKQEITEASKKKGKNKNKSDLRKGKETSPFTQPAQKRYKASRKRGSVMTQASGHKNLSTGAPFSKGTKPVGTDPLRYEESTNSAVDELVDVLNEMGDEEPTVNDIENDPLEQDLGLRDDLSHEVDYRRGREELWSDADVLLETLEKLVSKVAGNPPTIDGINRLREALETPDLAAFVEQQVGMPPLDRTERSNLMADVDLVLSDYIFEKFEKPQQMNEGIEALSDPANYELLAAVFKKIVTDPSLTVAAAIGAAGVSIDQIRRAFKLPPTEDSDLEEKKKPGFGEGEVKGEWGKKQTIELEEEEQ